MTHETTNATLQQLVDALLELPTGRRARVIWQSLSFLPGKTLAESEQVGRYRALLASCWEELTARAMPIASLRELATSPSHTSKQLLLGKLAVSNTVSDLSDSLVALIRHLDQKTQSQTPAQTQLFPQATAPTPEIESPTYQGEVVRDLGELVTTGRKFGTVYADPPWSYNNAASRAAAVNHYPTMTFDEICAEPVSQLVEDNAHLHLWTTNAFLREAFDVINAWGFDYKSCLIWVKDTIGMGNYWRVSHEYLLLGVRGNLTFRERTHRSWLQHHRMQHSHKPEVVRTLIEKVSPGPYLELYGRAEIPNSPWTVYGNQVEKRLF